MKHFLPLDADTFVAGVARLRILGFSECSAKAILSGPNSCDTGYKIGLAVCVGLLVLAISGCRDEGTAPGVGVSDTRGHDAKQVARGPQPRTLPEIDLENIDNAVATAIREAMNSVRKTPDTAQNWGHLGMVLLAHDFRAPAAECFGHACQLNPNDARWPLFHARAIRTAEPLKAIPLMEKALALFPDSYPEALVLRLQLAELLIERHSLDKAVAQVQNVLALDDQNARAYYNLGRLRFLKDDFAGCLESIRRAEALGVTRKQGALLAAEAHRRLGDHQSADARRARAERLPSKSSWPDPFDQQLAQLRTGLKGQLSRAEYLYAQNKIDESKVLLKKTIADYPDSTWARILLARALIRQRQLAKAEQTLAEALELSPESVEAHFRMGVTFQLRQQYQEALPWFEQALRYKPDFAMAHRNLGFCLVNLGDFEAAAVSLHRAVESQPDFLDGWSLLGQIEEKRGKVEQARQAYQKALTLEPDNSEIRNRLRLLDVDTTVDPSDLDFEGVR